MPDTTYKINGVALDDPALRWFLGSDNPHTPIPTVRASSVELPGTHGAMTFYNEPFATVSHGLAITVTSNDSTGQDAGWNQLISNISTLSGLFSIRYKDHDLERFQGGIWTKTTARVLASTRPEYLDDRSARVTFVLTENPFWSELEPTRVSMPRFGAELKTWSLPELDGANAPITDMTITAPGPFSVLEVRDAGTGGVLRVEKAVAEGETLTISTSDFSAMIGDTDVSALLDVPTGGFEFSPVVKSDGSVYYQMSARRGGGDGAINLSVRRAYL